MKKHIYSSLLLFASFSIAKAQITSYDFYSYKQGNMFNVNPAYAGKGNGVNVVLNGQSQNNGVAYSDKDIMAGVYSKVSAKQAIGGKLISDTRGAFQILKADLSYAYTVKIASEHSLTLGLSAGILNNNLLTSRIDNYQRLDQTDPTLTKSYYNTTQFSAGFGLLYIYKALEVSVSLPNIVTTNQSINGYLNSAVFYTFKAGSKFKITPWVTYQNIPVTKGVGALLVKATYKDMFWVQTGYQTNKSFCAMLGVNIENIGISYGYNFSNSAFSTISNGRQEIMLSYKILHRKQNKVVDETSSPANASLTEILARLDNLAKMDITDKNITDIKKELQILKQQLQSAEIDNSNPEKAKQVSEQLSQIDEKLKIIEKKLLNEK